MPVCLYWPMLYLLLALVLSALPAGLLLFYFYRRDSARPEPLGLVWKSVLFGFVAVVPAAAFEIALQAILPPLPGLLEPLVEAFLVAGLIEESVKLFFVKRYIFRRPEFDERADGVVYAVCVSLGFAFVEDFLYGFSDLRVLLFRAFTAVPLHAICAGLMGYYIGIAKVEGRSGANPKAAGAWKRGLLWAILIHGLYDFFILTNSVAALLVIPLLIVAWRVVSRLYRRAIAADGLDSRPVFPAAAGPAPPAL